MASRKSGWKSVGWCAVVVLLAFGSYMSAYFGAVVRGVEAWETPAGRFVSVRAGYVLRWPHPAEYNSPWLANLLDTVFTPAHQMDRIVRPDSWPETYFVHNQDVVPVSGVIDAPETVTSTMETDSNVGQQQ